jgi:hypothetical protein
MSSHLLVNRGSDLDFVLINTHTVTISNRVAVRVYSDTRPHNLELADLQKGLILICDGAETVGEGTGFGFPVLVCRDETYFPGTSKVYLSKRGDSRVIQKEFVMDRIARNRFKNIKLENQAARAFLAYLAGLYQEHSRFRFLRLKRLIGRMNVNTTFVETVPLGKVMVTFAIDKQHIMVRADFSCVKREGIEKIFMLNEQGSRFFRLYVDSQGKRLTDREIGAWDRVGAEWASLIIPQTGFGFRLWDREDCIFRRGREFLTGSLDWIGLDYELKRVKTTLEYMIQLLRT